MGDRGRLGGEASVVGREVELARLDDFVRNPSPGHAIVLIGEAGFGKTTLMDAAAELARGQGVRVLPARPSETASRLPFGGLIDLCEQLDEPELTALPGPQRRALEVALARAESAGRAGCDDGGRARSARRRARVGGPRSGSDRRR